MSADLSTEIKITGTKEELTNMLKVIFNYTTINYEQYKQTGVGLYLDLVTVKSNNKKIKITQNTKESEIEEFSNSLKTTLELEAGGLYGSIGSFDDIASNSEKIPLSIREDLKQFPYISSLSPALFKDLATAAPNANFKGIFSGFITGADVSLEAELKNKKLYLSSYYEDNEFFSEIYPKAIMKQLSHAKFCKIFKVDKDDFDKDCYIDFINEAIRYEGFPDMDYDDFTSYCDSTELDEDEYEEALEKIENIEFIDFDTFYDNYNKSELTTSAIYNPLTEKYEK